MRERATRPVVILGTFVADLTFVAGRVPAMGETILGEDFRIGPGGKGSNQAVAARRAGADVLLVAKLGRDDFGDMARKLYAAEGISARHLIDAAEEPTGAAWIFVDSRSGENAIIIVAGAGGAITPAEVEAAAEGIAGAAVFMTQMEVPSMAAARGLENRPGERRDHGVQPGAGSAVFGIGVRECRFPDPERNRGRDADRGAGARPRPGRGGGRSLPSPRAWAPPVITLGERGAFVKSRTVRAHVPAFDAGAVVETTGAGDAFNGAFAAALAEGASALEAVRFGCAAGALSVTRAGTAPSMPRRPEIETLLDHG